MPDREVKTIRDLIYYQYAKIVARSALGPEAKGKHYGFVKATFRKLKSGEKKWSDITREDWQLVASDKVCIYCGAAGRLVREHIVPRCLHVTDACATCPTIQEIHNQVWACPSCNSVKGTLGLYTFFQRRLPDDSKYYDRIPPLVEKKYLKTAHDCIHCAGLLDAGDVSGDGDITVTDIDRALARFIRT